MTEMGTTKQRYSGQDGVNSKLYEVMLRPYSKDPATDQFKHRMTSCQNLG